MPRLRRLKAPSRGRVVRKSQLAEALQAVPDFETPEARYEQYVTPAAIAADLLWAAHDDGDLAGKRVVDLGCGPGVLTLGAVLLGAEVTAMDISAAGIAQAMAALEKAGKTATFVEAEITTWQPDAPFDTAIMNPPFGSQYKGADRAFYDAAKRATYPNGVVWFLAQPKTERFLSAQARDLGGKLERVMEWPYPIEARFDFHDKAVRSIRVGAYRMTWN
jgi:putative methylase